MLYHMAEKIESCSFIFIIYKIIHFEIKKKGLLSNCGWESWLTEYPLFIKIEAEIIKTGGHDIVSLN